MPGNASFQSGYPRKYVKHIKIHQHVSILLAAQNQVSIDGVGILCDRANLFFDLVSTNVNIRLIDSKYIIGGIVYLPIAIKCLVSRLNSV